MSVGIYKLTNKINGKVYIGQSIKIEKRFKEHNLYRKSIVGKAINKYGIENFSSEILELCTLSDIDEREQHYIALYNSVVPNGYNIQTGGKENSTSFCLYDSNQFMEIVKDLEDTDLTIEKIADKNKVSIRTIYRINSGSSHILENKTYPLRDRIIFTGYSCIDCGNKVSGKRCVRCITCQETYQKRAERPTELELAKEILDTNFRAVGIKYGVSDNAIRKWCTRYGMPYKKDELNKWYEKNKVV